MKMISFPHSCMSFFFFFLNHTSDINRQARAQFNRKTKFFDRCYSNTPRNGPHSRFGASNGQHKVLREHLKCSWGSPLLTPFPRWGCTMQDVWVGVLVLSQILNPVTTENTELLPWCLSYSLRASWCVKPPPVLYHDIIFQSHKTN